MAQRNVRVGNIKDVSGEVIIAGRDIYKGYTAEQVSVLLTQITSTFQPKPFDGRCPYKGLDVFEEEDAELFFGRERLVDDLISRVKESRTVFITGPSGSGKSSLVRAGLIHALKQGAIKNLHSERWLYETMKPGREPIKDLALAFSRLKSPDLADYFQAHANETDVLNKCAESVLSGRKDQRFVLFVDQFEEVFTQINQEEERLTFLNMLAHAGTVENGRVIVLFAMRSDFVSNCATYPQLNNLLSQQFIQIGSMQPDELVSAIAQPALRVGLRIDPDLIAQIINDMQGEPGALPLMQFALKDLFDSQESKDGVIALTLNDYIQRGGIRKSLERHADDAFTKLTENEQVLARSIFSGLIEIGRGRQDTRRTALFDELIPANTKAEDVEAIVQKLADARLITTDEQAGKDTVTISHEKLIDAWPWLKKLVNENRDVIALQNEIAADAEEWDGHKRDSSYLYIGARLAIIREKSKEIALSEKVRAFVKASIDAQEKNYRRATRTRRWVIIGLSLTAVVMTGLAIWAIYQTNQATQKAQIAHARELSAIAQSKYQSQFDLSLLLSVEALRENDNYQTRGTMLDTLRSSPHLRQFLFGHTSSLMSIAFSPDGKTLASGSCGKIDSTGYCIQGEIILRNATSGQPIAPPLTGDTAAVSSIAFSLDGKTLASGSCGKIDSTGSCIQGEITLWDTTSGRPIGHSLTEQTGIVSSVAFSPDGKTLASAGNTVILWDVSSHQPIGEPLTGNSGPVSSVAFSPDGKILASGGWDTTVILWDVSSHQPIGLPLRGHSDIVSSVAFSPDGETLASGSYDGSVILWNVLSVQPIGQSLTGHANAVYGVAFSPDGETLASGSYDGTVILWNVTGRESIGRPLSDNGDVASTVAFSPDGKTLASGSCGKIDSTDYCSQSEIILWDIPSGQPIGLPLTGHTSFITSVAFSPDGKTLASGSYDKTVILWHVTSLRPIGQPLRDHSDIVSSVAFSPDGKILASGSSDGTVILWDVASRRPIGQPLTGHTEGVTSVAFSPDGKILASGSTDKNVILWDVTSHEPIGQPLTGHTFFVSSVAFSPDGKTLASGSYDGSVILWNAVKRQPIGQPLSGHSEFVQSVAFSPDGKILASSSWDNTIILWDVETRQPVGQPLKGAVGGDVAFSPDGKTLASEGSLGGVNLWEVDPEWWMKRACEIAGRNFTRAEWAQYFSTDKYRKTCEQWPLESGPIPTPTSVSTPRPIFLSPTPTLMPPSFSTISTSTPISYDSGPTLTPIMPEEVSTPSQTPLSP